MASHFYTGEPPKSFDPPKRRARVTVDKEQRIKNFRASIENFQKLIDHNQQRLDRRTVWGMAATTARLEIESWERAIKRCQESIERLEGK